MTSAVSSASQQVYTPPASPNGGPTDDPSGAVGGASATAPAAPSATGGPLLAPSTVSALVAEQTTAAANDPPAAAASAPYDSYEAYMPTRDGFSAYALALGVDSPGSVSSSAGKTDDEIATDARSRLDANYAKMTASGQPFDYGSYEGQDWYSLMGDLDPQSLTAVKDNRDGLFNDQEQTLAQHFLDIQSAFRQGCYNGPTRLMGQYMASGASAMSQADAATAMQQWDTEAAKKSTDVGTELGRASMRVLLGPQLSASLFGDPKDAMLSLLVDALQKALAKDPKVLGSLANIHTVADLEKQDWFKDDIQQLNAIIQGAGSQTDSGAPDLDAATTPAQPAS